MNIFLSYARADRAFVRSLHDALVGRKCDVWVDWEDIPPTAVWLAEVFAGIEGADTFLFVISPDSVASETCHREIAHALKHAKRLIPVVRRDADPKAVPDGISVLNWVFFREADDFGTSLQSLMQALDTDIEWVHAHTRLLLRALDWEKRSRDDSLLLRGRDLRDAQAALASVVAGQVPVPTDLQVEFVRTSRSSADRRRRRTLAAVSLGVAVAAVLACTAWWFSQQGDLQHKRAAANALIVRAQALRESGPNMLPASLLLALESQRLSPSAEADRFLRDTVSLLPRSVGRLAHDHAVTSLAFSPDSRLLATADADDKSVRIWDVATQREMETLRHSGALAGYISTVAFTPDGLSLFTVGLDGVTVWDVATAQMNRRLAEGETLVTLAISGDGKYLATGGHDGTVMVRELATGTEVFRGRHDMLVNALAWSPDSRFLASASNDKTARVWEVPVGQVLSLPHGIGPRGVAWSPDGNWIATGGWEGIVRVWERETGRERSRFDAKSTIQAVAFSADGSQVIAALADKTARAWDLTSGTENTRMIHDGEVTALAVSPDGRYVATGSKDRTAALWDLRGRGETTRLAHPDWTVDAVAYDPEGKRLATVSDRSVRVWELADGHELARLDHEGRVHAVAFSADGKSVITTTEGSSSASVVIWDVASGRVQRQLPVRDTCVAFSRDAAYFVSGDVDEGVMVRQVETGGVIVRITKDVTGRFTSAVAISADRRLLAASVNDGTRNYQTYVWETAGGIERCHFDHESRVTALTFSPDGKSLAFSGPDNSVRVCALDTCRETARISLAEEIIAVAFSPDGTLLATGCRDRTARVWEATTGNELARLTFGGVVNDVTFSPDGRFVAAASSDRTARVWRWRFEEDLTTTVCSRVGRSLTRDEWREYFGELPYHETCAGLTGPESSTASVLAVASPTKPEDPAPPARSATAPTDAHELEIEVRDDLKRTVTALIFLPDGSRLAVADNKGVGFWNLTSGCLDGRILGATEDWKTSSVEKMTLSRDGNVLAYSGFFGGALIFDLQAGKVIHDLETDDVESLAFSPDAKLLATGDSGHVITLWNVASGTQLRQLREHQGTVNAVAFSPDGRMLVSGADDSTTRFSDVASGDEVRRVKAERGRGTVTSVRSVAFSPDGRVVANNVQLLDASSGVVLQELESTGDPVEQVVFSPRGDVLAGASGARLALWDAKDGHLLRASAYLNVGISSLSFSLDGSVLAGGASDCVVLWSVVDCKPVARLIAIGDKDWVVTSPDGHFDASPGALSEVRYYEDGKPMASEAIRKKFLRTGLLVEVLAGVGRDVRIEQR